MFIYLDESGDLGFDFENKKPSQYFVITLMQVNSLRSVKFINKAVAKTLANKINHQGKGRMIAELKGSDTRIEIKEYFLKYINRHVHDLKLYAIMLDKQQLLSQTSSPIKDRIYNQMTHQILEKIKFPKSGQVNLITDRCKNSFGISEFNEYLYANLTLCLNLETPLYISHDNSINNKGIQAVDLFCYGIARKYEQKDFRWYNQYQDKIMVECKFRA